MKNLYVTLFSAFLLGSTICTGCAEKKTGSSGEVIEMIHKVNGYWQMNHPEHGRSFWDNALQIAYICLVKTKLMLVNQG